MGLARPSLLFVLVVAGGVLASCGYKAQLTRLPVPQAAILPPAEKDARAAERREVEEQLRPAASARPQRVDDLTVTLGVRGEDPFDLPPEGTKGANPAPFPGDPGSAKDDAADALPQTAPGD